MPKFLCKCGEVISYSEIPCELEYKFISDSELDNYTGKTNIEDLYINMNSFFKCPTCNRLWVFWNDFLNEPTEYIQVNDKQ